MYHLSAYIVHASRTSIAINTMKGRDKVRALVSSGSWLRMSALARKIASRAAQLLETCTQVCVHGE